MRVSSKLGHPSAPLLPADNSAWGRTPGGNERKGREGRGGEGREDTLVTAAVMTQRVAIVLARAVWLQSVAPKQLQHNAIPDHVHHHRPPSTHTPQPTTIHYCPPTYPHPPSRTPHLQEASLPLVGRQPLQVMGEQGSLQVADGHVADVATWVTAHASHSLGGGGAGKYQYS